MRTTLYSSSREDDSVRERLFIKRLALLHMGMLGNPVTSAIQDLFYLDGMTEAPSERGIQRIAEAAITQKNKKDELPSIKGGFCTVIDNITGHETDLTYDTKLSK